MLKFFATTHYIKKIRSENSSYNRGKRVKKAAGNCFLQFPIHNSTASRAVFFCEKTESDRE